MVSNRIKIIILMYMIFSCLVVLPVIAQESDDLAAKTQNPVGAMYSLPFKFNFDYGAENGEASFLNIQPVLPQTIGEWNLIHRIILPLIDTPGAVTGTPAIPNPIPGDGATGLGDINYSVYLSPAEPDKVIWVLDLHS